MDKIFIDYLNNQLDFQKTVHYSRFSPMLASTFAVSSLSEGLANDLKPFGIHVPAVSPGWFRTNFAKPDSITFSKKQIADYDFMRAGHEKFNEMDGKQSGNPDKVADA